MWYWVLRFEGIVLSPLAVVYFALRGIPFTLRCKKCRRWLTDPTSIREGICESCHREVLFSGTEKFYQERYAPLHGEAPHAFKWDPARWARNNYYRGILSRVGQGKVLDVGCGRGYLVSRLKLQRGRTVTGMDVTPGLLRFAESWVSGVEFCLADARSLPFESNTFDYLTCANVLEVIEGNDAVKECYRVLKPGGVALIIVPNGKGVHGGYLGPTVVRYTFEGITAVLREAGFEIVSGHKFGLYIPFVCRFIDAVYVGLNMAPIYPTLLNINVPEFLATSFLIECRKPPV